MAQTYQDQNTDGKGIAYQTYFFESVYDIYQG